MDKSKAHMQNRNKSEESETSNCIISTKQNFAYVYILQCSDNTFYSGFTFDVEKRVAAHNAKKGAKYTRGRVPVTLVYKECCENKSAALKREREIKKLTRTEKINLISTYK